MIINVKTEYNFLQSICTVDDVINYALKNNLKAIGICENDNTFSAFEFYNKCQKHNIKPIYGVKITYQKQRILCYAKNNLGFKRLNELLTMDEITFSEHEENLIFVLDKGPLIDKLLKTDDVNYIYEQLSFINKNDIYIGIISYFNDSQNYNVKTACEQHNLPFLYSDEVGYLDKSKFKSYLAIRAIERNTTINSLPEIKYRRHYVEKYLNNNNLFYEQFNDKINLNLEQVKGHIVKYNEEDSFDKLSRLAFTGLNKRNLSTAKYIDRLNYELKTINELGYNDYFLIVWDIVKYCYVQNIMVGPGRGSAAGSLVSYCLGITQIDPLKHGLLFERFLNPIRTTMPDIDLDFEDVHRETVVNYINERFEHSAKIGTVNRFQAKSAFRDVAKAFNFDKTTIELINKNLDSDKSYEQNLITVNKIKVEYGRNSLFRDISDHVMNVENHARNSSIHAAGIVVSDKPLSYFGVVKNNVIYQEAKTLEQLGLLKIDILSLSNLTFMHNISKRIQAHVDPNFDINKIAIDDKLTYDLISAGKTLGIFQLENEGMIKALKLVKPNNYDELANMLALYRPGPLKEIENYVKNKGNYRPRTKVDFILQSTNGIIVYQEQIMELVQVVANFTMAEADIFRRAISKKDQKTLEANKEKFITNGLKNNYDNAYLHKLYENILYFADFGFNKAHAYSYAKLVYSIAYLKVNYPTVFLSELFKLKYKSNDKDKFILDLKAFNIKIYCPNIFKSNCDVAAGKNYIILGLSNIKGLSTDTCKQIIENRKLITEADKVVTIINKLFKDVKLTEQQIDAIVSSGSLDSLKFNRETLRFNISNIVSKNAFFLLDEELIDFQIKESLSFTKESEKEYNAIGININYDLFDIEYNKQLVSHKDLITIDQVVSNLTIHYQQSRIYKVFVKLISCKEITTKTNKKMAFLTVESAVNYDVTVFTNEYEQFKGKLQNLERNYCILYVKIQNDKIYLQKI